MFEHVEPVVATTSVAVECHSSSRAFKLHLHVAFVFLANIVIIRS